MLVHIYSPFLYMLFVKILYFFEPCPESFIMKLLRKIHNILLSILSFLMFIGLSYGCYIEDKFQSVNNLLCSPITNNISSTSLIIFLYSKYLEWGDTLFLHLSGKSISMLQYTHHMTTAFLVYINMIDYLSPHFFIFVSMNCLVHIPMYWYFAFPKGILYKYRKCITRIQIFQHIVSLITIIYTMCLNNCQQNKYGNQVGLLLYSMYLFYFTSFYINAYLKKIK